MLIRKQNLTSRFRSPTPTLAENILKISTTNSENRNLQKSPFLNPTKLKDDRIVEDRALEIYPNSVYALYTSI